MHKDITFVFCLMSLTAVAAFAPIAFAQESINATMNDSALGDAALNNTTLNNTTLNNTALNSTALNNTTLENAALGSDAVNLAALEEAAMNLSTINNATVDTAPISDMAKTAPEVAAKASSVQVATDPESVFKIGEGIGGKDLFEVKDRDVQVMEIGMPIKSIRDVGKMVFVCDIV